jgi:hypothetical protein
MRFINRDTYDVSNRYAYCDGNSVEKYDPNGHGPEEKNLLTPKEKTKEPTGGMEEKRSDTVSSAGAAIGTESTSEMPTLARYNLMVGSPLTPGTYTPQLSNDQAANLARLEGKPEGGTHGTVYVKQGEYTYYVKNYSKGNAAVKEATAWIEVYRKIQPEYAWATIVNMEESDKLVLPAVGRGKSFKLRDMESEEESIELCKKIQGQFEKLFGHLHPDLYLKFNDIRVFTNIGNLVPGESGIIYPIDFGGL